MSVVDLPAVPRVLIAEADPWSRDLLKQVLLNVRCDARLDVCADGRQAATLLRDKVYDLILADWELPGIDGLSLLRNVRQQRRSPALPFILLSSRNDSASVREALPLAPTAYLTKPLNMDGLTQRLQDLLLNEGESVYCEVPRLAPGMTLPVFLERRRDACDGAPLWVDVKAAVQDSLGPEGLDLNRLEDRVRMDPQITAVLIAAANSAGNHGTPVQTLSAALHTLLAGQSMNLILGLALKHNVVLGEPGLVAYAERHWQLSQDTADFARRLARMLELDHERCYSAGILHRLGDLALLRCLEDWRQGGGALDDEAIGESLHALGAAYGSSLRTRWRLPLELRQLIAAVYSLEGGVYSREALVMNLALLRCLEDWRQGGGALDDEAIGESLHALGAGYGSSLRTRWRLPLELRQLIAAVYSLEGGVYSREALVMNLAAQMARLTEQEGLEALARSKTARLLKVGLSELMRLRKA